MNYPTQTDNPSKATSYCGWTNYETWNVALWLQNEHYLYQVARECLTFYEFRTRMKDVFWKTPDGVLLTDRKLNLDELDECITEL